MRFTEKSASKKQNGVHLNFHVSLAGVLARLVATGVYDLCLCPQHNIYTLLYMFKKLVHACQQHKCLMTSPYQMSNRKDTAHLLKSQKHFICVLDKSMVLEHQNENLKHCICNI